MSCHFFALGVTVASWLISLAVGFSCSKAWESCFVWSGGRLPLICFQTSSSDHIPHEADTKRHTKLIWQNPTGYVHRMSFNSSRWISIFQLVTHAADLTTKCCNTETIGSRLRERKNTINDCYSKIDFEVIQVLCICIQLFHYSCTILNQMSRHRGLNEKHDCIWTDAKTKFAIQFIEPQLICAKEQ